jgi:hypothetical protein
MISRRYPAHKARLGGFFVARLVGQSGAAWAEYDYALQHFKDPSAPAGVTHRRLASARPAIRTVIRAGRGYAGGA